MSNAPRQVWESEPKAPAPILLTELQDSPALRGLLQPVGDAAAAMKSALEAAMSSADENAKALLERIEVRDTSLIATLNEVVAAIGKLTVQATLETPNVVVNVPQQPAPVVNVAAPAVTVSPTIVAESTPRTWTFTHTYDGFGNLTATKAVPAAV